MRPLFASLLFLTATITYAQTPVLRNLPDSTFTSGQTISAQPGLPDNFGCPVGFSASRQANPQTMLANDRSQAGPAQGLHLTLHPLQMPAIKSIEVTVYGTSTKLRALPVGAAPSSDTISKTFELQRQAGSSSLTEADVWMHNVGSLTRVDLISITYADGATWHPTENFKCRAIPSNFLLVEK